MSIFKGKHALKSQFKKLTFTELNTAAAVDKASSVLWLNLNSWGKFLYLDNTLADASGNGIDIQILAVHPEADVTDPANKLEWLELPGLRVMNFGVGDAPGVSFDPGTRFYVYLLGTPTSGAIRIFSWG